MSTYDRLIYFYLNLALTDDYIDIDREISLDISCEFPHLDKRETVEKMIEFIRYILETKYFVIGSSDGAAKFKKWNMNANETIDYIEKQLLKYNMDEWWKLSDSICFDLSEQGKDLAINLHKKRVVAREQVLLAAHKNPISLYDVIELTKAEFHFKKPDEIKFWVHEVLWRLIDNHKLMVPGHMLFGIFLPWRLPSDSNMSYIENEWNQLGRDPKRGEIVWFKNTPEVNQYIEKWKQDPGIKMIPYWSYWYDFK